MAIAATMSHNTNNEQNNNNNDCNSNSKDDDHEHDMVMPGFRFHPTEEELVEFYLRRKVEGKRFNVELITFLDLYRYDPWELPALAAIGEKEWFFYVPRDRKYRNGDRPNRVTTSGYWKATGADRMIRTESSRSIGLKKTLVFYSGKAPKGIRTSWIMNEYRLPHHETERYQKVEISLCRVYKRAGVEDHPSLPRSLPSRASSSRGPQSDKKHQSHLTVERFQPFVGQSSQQIEMEKMSETDASSSSDVTTALGLSKHNSNAYHPTLPISNSLGLPASVGEGMFLNLPKQASSSLIPSFTNLFSVTSSVSSSPVDDLHRLLNYQQASINHHHQQQQQQQFYLLQQPQHQSSQLSSMTPQTSQQLPLNMLPDLLPPTFPDRLWEWNQMPEANRDFNNPFK
ncbi:NAC domain-containing protein 35-like [Populus alba x Populus x berolinensis]|nr:NAC domain-containing protein 35-like [Populus alba x Populus x berolinensis]